MINNRLPFTKSFLLEQYKKDVNTMLDECDWISHIEDWRMCGIICDIVGKNGFKVDNDKLLSLYTTKVNSLSLSKEEWQEQYGDWDIGLPKIIDMVYKILESYN